MIITRSRTRLDGTRLGNKVKTTGHHLSQVVHDNTRRLIWKNMVGTIDGQFLINLRFC